MRARRASSRDHFGPVVTSPGERRICGAPTQAGSNTPDAEVAEGVFIVEKCTGDFLRRDISVLCRCLPTDGVTGSTWSFEMKLKEVFYMLGMKPKRKIYGCDVVSINVAGFGDVDWALWQNPRARVRPRLGDLSVLSRVIEPGDFAIDVGAHVGDTSLVPALLAGLMGWFCRWSQIRRHLEFSLKMQSSIQAWSISMQCRPRRCLRQGNTPFDITTPP